MKKFSRRLRYEVTPLKPSCGWYGCGRDATHEAVPHVVIHGDVHTLPEMSMKVCGTHALDCLVLKDKVDAYLDEGRVAEVAVTF